MALLLDDALETRVLSHYYLVAETMAKHFAGEPICFANFPAGFSNPPHWHRTEVPMSSNKLLWLCHRMFAVEFHGWAPLPDQLDRLRFARILLEHSPDAARRSLAAATLRDMLAEHQLQAAPVLDSKDGITLWIPLADAPPAENVRTWLHAFCNDAVARRPDLFTTEPNTHDVKRVHLHVASNAPWRFSVLPYSLRGDEGLPVATPFRWDELGTLNAAITADAFVRRWETSGDVFGDVLAGIPTQTFASLTAPQTMVTAHPRGSRAITAACDILEDGKDRTAQEILDEAHARGLLGSRTSRADLYATLTQYIDRETAHGRRPLFVQNRDRTFRINEPIDDWPNLEPQVQSTIDANTQALIDRLVSTSTGKDPAAFEIAVCDAFAHLGFAATHLGGTGAPDGYADAQVGVLGYRIMLECKTAQQGLVYKPDCVEASKYNAVYGAQYGLIIGPSFPGDGEVIGELRTHGVTAITVSDLRTLLSVRATPLEVRQLLKPGYASDVLSDVLWERTHGERKRIAVVAHLIRQEGWKAQVTAAQQGGPANAPLLNADAAMLLVDAALSAAGSARACTREQVEAAFSHLTDPLVDHAVWTDDSRSAIVVLTGPAQ